MSPFWSILRDAEDPCSSKLHSVDAFTVGFGHSACMDCCRASLAGVGVALPCCLRLARQRPGGQFAFAAGLARAQLNLVRNRSGSGKLAFGN